MMKKLNNVLIFLCSLAAACFFVRDLNVGAYDRLLGDITIPLVLLLPRIFSNNFCNGISLRYLYNTCTVYRKRC